MNAPTNTELFQQQSQTNHLLDNIVNRAKGVDVDAEHKAFMEKFAEATDRVSRASGLGFQRDDWFPKNGMGAVTGANQYDVTPLAQKFPSLHRDATKNYYTYAPRAGDLIERYFEMYVTAPAEGLIDARKTGRDSQRHFRLGIENVPEGVYANSYLMNMNFVKLAGDGKDFTVKYERDEWGNQLQVKKKLIFTDQEAAETVRRAMELADELRADRAFQAHFDGIEVNGESLPESIENLDQLQAVVEAAKRADVDNNKIQELANTEIPWDKVAHYWKKVKPEKNKTITAGVTTTGAMEEHIERYGTKAYQEIPRSNLLSPQTFVRDSERQFARAIVERLEDVRNDPDAFHGYLKELNGKVIYDETKDIYTVFLRGANLAMDLKTTKIESNLLVSGSQERLVGEVDAGDYARGETNRAEIVHIRELKYEIPRSLPKFQHGQNANSTTEIVHSQRSWDIYEVSKDDEGKWKMQAKDWVHSAGLPMDPAARERMRFDPNAGLEFRMKAMQHNEGTKEHKHNMERYKQAFMRKNLGFLTNVEDPQTLKLINQQNDFPPTRKQAKELRDKGELPEDYDLSLNNAELKQKLWNKWQEMTGDVEFSRGKEAAQAQLKEIAFGPNPQTAEVSEEIETYFHDHMLPVWNHPMNAKLSLTHYGELSLSNNPPLVVDRNGEMNRVKPMQEVRLYHPSFGNYLYEHSTGDVTHSSMGGRAFGGGNIKAFGKFGHSYIHDKYMMDYIKEYNPYKNKRAKDHFTDSERLAPDTFTDASHYMNTRLVEKASELSKYIFAYELATTEQDDALPQIRAAKTMAETHRELTLSAKNLASGIARFAGGGAMGAGLAVGASILGGFTLTTAGAAVTAVVAPIAGLVAGSKVLKNYAENRFVGLHAYERQSNSDVRRIYDNPAGSTSWLGFDALKQDAGLFIRALRKKAYEHNYKRTGIESTDTVGQLTLAAGGVFIAGAITAAATSVIAVATAPLLLAAGAAAAAFGTGQLVMGQLAEKGRAHWQNSYFNDAGMDRYRNVMQNTVADTTLRVTAIDFERNMPQNKEYIDRITKKGKQLDKSLGIDRANTVDESIRMTDAELAIKEAEAELKFRKKVDNKLHLTDRMHKLQQGGDGKTEEKDPKQWAEEFKKEAKDTFVSKEDLRKLLREEMAHNRAN